MATLKLFPNSAYAFFVLDGNVSCSGYLRIDRHGKCRHSCWQEDESWWLWWSSRATVRFTFFVKYLENLWMDFASQPSFHLSFIEFNSVLNSWSYEQQTFLEYCEKIFDETPWCEMNCLCLFVCFPSVHSYFIYYNNSRQICIWCFNDLTFSFCRLSLIFHCIFFSALMFCRVLVLYLLFFVHCVHQRLNASIKAQWHHQNANKHDDFLWLFAL